MEHFKHQFLPLKKLEPCSWDSLVWHSGIADALTSVKKVLTTFADTRNTSKNTQEPLNSCLFQVIFLHGPVGSGKSHLVRVAQEDFLKLELHSGLFAHYDNWQDNDDRTARFISEYQQLKAQGGLMFITSRKPPSLTTRDPHITSRLLSGLVLDLSYPAEQELMTVAREMVKRFNMQLSEKNLNYLLRRLPVNPLSFVELFDRLDTMCLSEGISPRQKAISKVVNEH